MTNDYLDTIINDTVKIPEITLKKTYHTTLAEVVESFNEALDKKLDNTVILFRLFIKRNSLTVIDATGTPMTLWDIHALLGVARCTTLKGTLEEKLAQLITIRLNHVLGKEIRNKAADTFNTGV